MSKIKLGIPKGSLENATIELFKKSGWVIRKSSRNYFPNVDDKDISCSLVRAQEMSKYVADGTFDLGLTGKDWILENKSDVEVICDLVYSKVSAKPTKWVVAVAEGSGINTLEDLEGKKVSTELVNHTKEYFASKGINVEIEFSWGATEAKVVEGLVDAIVEVTETGSTIKAHGLKIIHEMMQSNTQLIANKEAMKDPWKKQKISQISTLLNSALKANGMVGIKMNVAKDGIDKIVDILPSITAPTISHLYKSDWLSVETIVSEHVVREVLPKLIDAGAKGIIEYSLNKLI
ncbi:ATP phosphoribosyltransferase [Thermodesulfobacteriota bacterium]